MTTTNYTEVLQTLKERKFPEFPDDDAFSNWVAELAEMGGHVTGLAMQAAAGQNIDKCLLKTQYAEFQSTFCGLSVTTFNEKDKTIHAECTAYIRLLGDVVESLTR